VFVFAPSITSTNKVYIAQGDCASELLHVSNVPASRVGRGWVDSKARQSAAGQDRTVVMTEVHNVVSQTSMLPI
jgi:hypothetical protein